MKYYFEPGQKYVTRDGGIIYQLIEPVTVNDKPYWRRKRQTSKRCLIILTAEEKIIEDLDENEISIMAEYEGEIGLHIGDLFAMESGGVMEVVGVSEQGPVDRWVVICEDNGMTFHDYDKKEIAEFIGLGRLKPIYDVRFKPGDVFIRPADKAKICIGNMTSPTSGMYVYSVKTSDGTIERGAFENEIKNMIMSGTWVKEPMKIEKEIGAESEPMLVNELEQSYLSVSDQSIMTLKGKSDSRPGYMLVTCNPPDGNSIAYFGMSESEILRKRESGEWIPYPAPIPEWPSQTQSATIHPEYYGGKDNPYEAIKVIRAWGLGFNLGNVVKYIARAGKKSEALPDLIKARDYINFAIEELKNQK
jgi:Protein of unknwon function (DUF3310)